MAASDDPNKQLLAVLFSHSIIVKLITSQLLSQICSTTLVIVVYDRDTVLQVVHNRGHGFRKVLPGRGAPIATHTRSTSEKPNQNPTRPSRQSNHRIQKYFRGPPLKVDPQRSRPAPRRTQGCGDGCKRLGTQNRACRYRGIVARS